MEVFYGMGARLESLSLKFPRPGRTGARWLKMVRISYLAGFITACSLLLCAFKKNRSPYDKEQILNLMTFQIIGVWG